MKSVTCDDEVEAQWDTENWSLKITGNKKHVNKIKCNVDFTVTLSNYLIAKSAYDESIVKEEHDATDQTGSNATTDYRYIGTDPNNYVCLASNGECTDEELYRIVGVIPTQRDENGEYENRVKLISNTSYGNRYWMGNKDSTVFDWKTSTLNTETLNTEYWDKISDYHQYIELAKWYINGADVSESFLSTYYHERAGTNHVIANIGMIYPSDAGFASELNNEERQTCLNSLGNGWANDLIYCGSKNWLLKYGKMTITAGIKSDYYIIVQALSLNKQMGGKNSSSLSTLTPVYPSFYLRAGVKYLNGTGEKSNPYRIMINE